MPIERCMRHDEWFDSDLRVECRFCEAAGVDDMKAELEELLAAKPETGEQWAVICALEERIISEAML